MKKTCFVIMAIGDQYDASGNILITHQQLRKKYDQLIKEAIQKSINNVEVIRADDISNPGTISTDIMLRIMQSDYVIADITYPNPNVFYELGLRHACRVGTIIIKGEENKSIPFDISHQRYISYSNDLDGLQKLSQELRSYFEYYESKQGITDNYFLEMAKIIQFSYPQFKTAKKSIPRELMLEIINNPKLQTLLTDAAQGKTLDQTELLKEIFKNKELAMLCVEQAINNSD